MKQSFRTLAAALALLLALVAPVAAQTTLNSTTLSAAVTAAEDARIIPLTSTSNITVGDHLVVVDSNMVGEAMQVNAINTGSVTVTRGIRGTSRRAHLSGQTVYTGAAGRFYGYEVRGACTRSSETFLPHITLPSGFIYQCSTAGVWYRLDQQVQVTCRALLVADQIDQSCFTAERRYVVTNITEVHTTAESAGTLTLIPRRQQSTEAAASGDALATAIDMVGAGAVAQTVKTATLATADPTVLILEAGNRLGLDYTDDVAGELAGVAVTFTIAPI